jgi:hypothetical protein
MFAVRQRNRKAIPELLQDQVPPPSIFNLSSRPFLPDRLYSACHIPDSKINETNENALPPVDLFSISEFFPEKCGF